jgi:hypothetical protein
MRVGNTSIEVVGYGNFLKLAAITVLLAGFLAAPSLGQQAGQKTFASPEEASKALYAAAKGNDEKAMLDLLGPDGKEIVSSGDEAEDAQSRAEFVKRYEEMNRLVKEPDGSVSLYIGAHNWPCPIPLMNKGNVWYFDTAMGKQEILFRRIGRNEISAIHVCRELAAAQKEYYSQQHNEYARRIHGEEGKHDGLYWKTAENETRSPIGPLVAQAVSDEETLPRLLFSHPHAPGEECPGRRENLPCGRQNDRLRLRGLPRGLPFVWRENFPRGRRRRRLREGLGQKDGNDRDLHARIQSGFRLAKIRTGTASVCWRAAKAIRRCLRRQIVIQRRKPFLPGRPAFAQELPSA